MDTKFNEIGTRTFHIKMVEFEGSVSDNLELTVGQYKPVILDANKLHELIEVLQQAERLFGLEQKSLKAPSEPIAGLWKRHIQSNPPWGAGTIATFKGEPTNGL